MPSVSKIETIYGKMLSFFVTVTINETELYLGNTPHLNLINSLDEMVNETREIFLQTEAAEDGRVFEIPLERDEN